MTIEKRIQSALLDIEGMLNENLEYGEAVRVAARENSLDANVLLYRADKSGNIAQRVALRRAKQSVIELAQLFAAEIPVVESRLTVWLEAKLGRSCTSWELGVAQDVIREIESARNARAIAAKQSWITQFRQYVLRSEKNAPNP